MNELCRLYSKGRVGMTVVLDHVQLSNEDPFAKYQQPAFFTIVEDLSDERRYKGIYVLQDQDGNRVSTEVPAGSRFNSSISSCLIDVTVWAAWKAKTAEEAIASRNNTIRDLSSRLAVLKEVMASQGVRVVSNEQAVKLGIKA